MYRVVPFHGRVTTTGLVARTHTSVASSRTVSRASLLSLSPVSRRYGTFHYYEFVQVSVVMRRLRLSSINQFSLSSFFFLCLSLSLS